MVLVMKNPPADPGDVRDVGSIPGSGRSPGGEHSNPLQCSFLENPMDRGAWRATVHKVAKSRTRVKHLSMQAQMNGCSFVPVKLYQQKQAGGQIWLKTCSLLTPTLKHYTNTLHPWSRSGNAGHKPEAQKPMRGPLLSLTSSSYSSRLSLLQSHSLLAALQTNLHPTASGPLHSLFAAWSVCSLSSPLGLRAHRLLSSAPLSTLGESFSEYPIKTYSTHLGQYFLYLSPLLSFSPWSSSPSENAIILLTRFTCFLSVPSNTRMEALGGEPFLFCPFGHCNPSPDSRIVLGTVRTQ